MDKIIINRETGKYLDGVISCINEFLKNDNVKAHFSAKKSENKIEVVLYGDQHYFDFYLSADLSGLTKDVIIFTCSITRFNSYLKKAMTGNDSVEIQLTNNSVIFVNKKTSSKVTLKVYDTITDNDFKEAFEFLKKTMDKFEDATELTVGQTIIDFSKYVEKYVGLTGLSNSFAIKGNEIRYADPLSIIKYKMPSKYTKDDEEIYITTKMFSFISNMLKFNSGDYNIKMSDDGFIYVNSNGLQGILTTGNSRWEFPSDDDIESVLPEEDDRNVIEVNIEDLHALLDSFENVFDSSWKFKAVKIISSDELLNNKSLKVEHIDYNAEVHSILPIMNCKLIKASDGDSEHEFIISLQVVQDILNLIPSGEEIVEITYNNQSAESQIGLGINIKTSSVDAIICKMYET